MYRVQKYGVALLAIGIVIFLFYVRDSITTAVNYVIINNYGILVISVLLMCAGVVLMVSTEEHSKGKSD